METKTEFYNLFEKLLSEKREDNSSYLSNEKYLNIINELKGYNKSRRLNKFEIINIGGEEKLIAPVEKGSTNLLYYVKNNELYDILNEIHLNIGHGGKHRMMAEIKKKYKNLTQEVVLMYLKFCGPCQTKLSYKRKGLVVKPIIHSEMNSRCQVDLIDMQSQADGEFRFIMVYQDHLTKFVQLRALKSKTAEEVANNILDIFCIFGAPVILQSDNGREFVNKIINDLKIMWPMLKIVHGKPRHSQSQGSVERANQDIQNMLITWMQTNSVKSWKEGLRFVQLMKNKALHSGIQRYFKISIRIFIFFFFFFVKFSYYKIVL